MSGHIRNLKFKDDVLVLNLHLGKLAASKHGELHTICFGRRFLSLHLGGENLGQLREFGFLPFCRGKEK